MAIDKLWSQITCSRCPNTLKVRIMSWFTKEVICMNCSKKEEVIKKQLRAKGIDNALEGCGFIPDPENHA